MTAGHGQCLPQRDGPVASWTALLAQQLWCPRRTDLGLAAKALLVRTTASMPPNRHGCQTCNRPDNAETPNITDTIQPPAPNYVGTEPKYRTDSSHADNLPDLCWLSWFLNRTTADNLTTEDNVPPWTLAKAPGTTNADRSHYLPSRAAAKTADLA